MQGFAPLLVALSQCIGKNKPSVTIRTNSGSIERNKGVVKKRNKGGEGEVRESQGVLDRFYQFAEGAQVGMEWNTKPFHPAESAGRHTAALRRVLPSLRSGRKGTLLVDTLGTDEAIDDVIILSVKWQIVSLEQQVMQRGNYFLFYSLFCITPILSYSAQLSPFIQILITYINSKSLNSF